MLGVAQTLKFEIIPEKQWLEDDPLLWGPGNFSAGELLNFRGVDNNLLIFMKGTRTI